MHAQSGSITTHTLYWISEYNELIFISIFAISAFRVVDAMSAREAGQPASKGAMNANKASEGNTLVHHQAATRFRNMQQQNGKSEEGKDVL